jgi:hypothetical protein
MGLPQAEEGEELAHVAEYERLKVPLFFFAECEALMWHTV